MEGVQDMNLNNFTVKSQEIIQEAQLLAQEKQHGQIETGHFLVALLEKDEQVTPFLLKKVGANPAFILTQLEHFSPKKQEK